MTETPEKETLTPQEKRRATFAVKMQARNEALRATVREEDADLDAIVAQFGLPPDRAGMIRELLDEPHITAIAERHGVTWDTVRRLAEKIGVESGGWQMIRKPGRQEIEEAIKANPRKSANFIAGLVNETAPRIHYVRAKMRQPAQTGETSMAKRPPLSVAKRKIILDDLLQGLSPFEISKKREANVSTIRELAHQYWIPLNPSEKTLDAGLFLEAAKELVGRQLFAASFEERRIIEHLADQPGWIAGLHGIRALPQSKELNIVDAVLTHHLRVSGQGTGIATVEDLQCRTDRTRRLALDLPEEVFLAFHFMMAAKGVVLNRLVIRRANGKIFPQKAPKNDDLERMVVELSSNRTAPPLEQAFAESEPFEPQFRAAFPTLAEHIPPGALISKHALWRSVAQYWPDQAKFDHKLDCLLTEKRIYDHTGVNLNVLLMTFIREFGRGKKAAELLPEAEFVGQMQTKETLLEKCKQFARLMELHSGKLNDAGHISVDRESLQRALTRCKLKPDTIAQMLSLYSLAASPMVDGAITPLGDLVMTRMKIPYEEVAKIFDELPSQPEEVGSRKQRAHRPAQQKPPSTSAVPVATAA